MKNAGILIPARMITCSHQKAKINLLAAAILNMATWYTCRGASVREKALRQRRKARLGPCFCAKPTGFYSVVQREYISNLQSGLISARFGQNLVSSEKRFRLSPTRRILMTIKFGLTNELTNTQYAPLAALSVHYQQNLMLNPLAEVR